MSLQLFQEHYLRTPEAIRLLAAPMWLELESFLRLGVFGQFMVVGKQFFPSLLVV